MAYFDGVMTSQDLNCHLKLTVSKGCSVQKKMRGQGDLVALTVRVPKQEWLQLHVVAMQKGSNLQQLLLAAIANIL